jgi:hypothetical protein
MGRPLNAADAGFSTIVEIFVKSGETVGAQSFNSR